MSIKKNATVVIFDGDEEKIYNEFLTFLENKILANKEKQKVYNPVCNNCEHCIYDSATRRHYCSAHDISLYHTDYSCDKFNPREPIEKSLFDEKICKYCSSCIIFFDANGIVHVKCNCSGKEVNPYGSCEYFS